MARLPRVYIEGILYYVTSRGGHNQNVFRTPADYIEYMGLISKYKEQYGFKLFAFALLPTHLHMLVELKNNIGISNIMHDINSLYTKMFNSKYNTKGHLFEARFKTTLAHKENHLLDTIRHIHRNPKRERIVYDPKDYPYSSHAKYLDPQKRLEPDMTSEIEETFKMLNGREDAFSDYVNKITKKEAMDAKKRLKKRIAGPKAFQEKIKKIMENSSYQTQPAKRFYRMRRLYAALGMTALVAVLGLATFFSRQHTELMTEYDKTIAVYDRTIKMLKAEREKAVRQDGSAEEYAWKIRVAEESLSDLKREKDEAIKMARELEGSSYKIRLRQISGPETAFREIDRITFKDLRVKSANLAARGFEATNYTSRVLSNGKFIWETIQKNREGETASWRGEWDGKNINGVLSRRSRDGKTRDFSFIAVEKD